MTDTTFKREQRYIVFKLTDLQKHIEPSDLFNLQQIGRTVGAGREQDGKSPLECVVIESDWPEYDPTWRAIERRVSGAAQHAEGGEAAKAWDEGYRQGVEDERTSEANIGIAGFDAKVEPARQNPYRTTPPASQEQAQQPSAQAWANETGLRQIECPSCGDLAVAYDPQQPSGGEVVAYRLRDDEASERYGKDVFVYWSANEFRDHPSKPKLLALIEPLTIATPKPEPMTWQPIETAPKDGSDVLVCSTQCVGRFAVASWDGEEWRDMGDIGWAGMDGGGNQPTHWMPIPPAPITKGEA